MDSRLPTGAEAVLRIKPAGLGDQDLSEGRIEPPVAALIGIGERAASDLPSDAHMIELGLLCVQAGHRVAQAVTIG